jgi:hypothetical protein
MIINFTDLDNVIALSDGKLDNQYPFNHNLFLEWFERIKNLCHISHSNRQGYLYKYPQVSIAYKLSVNFKLPSQKNVASHVTMDVVSDGGTGEITLKAKGQFVDYEYGAEIGEWDDLFTELKNFHHSVLSEICLNYLEEAAV